MDLDRLYPSLAACQDRRSAEFWATYKLGTGLLESSFAPGSVVQAVLEAAFQLKPKFVVAAHLGIARALGGDWTGAKECLNRLRNHPQLGQLDLVRRLERACHGQDAGALRGVGLFRIPHERIELFQLERRRQAVCAFTLPETAGIERDGGA